MSCVPLLGVEVLHCYQWFEVGALAVGVVVEQTETEKSCGGGGGGSQREATTLCC